MCLFVLKVTQMKFGLKLTNLTKKRCVWRPRPESNWNKRICNAWDSQNPLSLIVSHRTDNTGLN